MIRQPSLEPEDPPRVLVDGGVAPGVPVSPPTPPVSSVVVVAWVEVVSDTSEVSVDVVCVDEVDVVDVCEQPHLGELNAAAAVPGMSSAAPSSMTAPSQPKRRSVTVLEWCPPVIRSLISLSPRMEWMIASRE